MSQTEHSIETSLKKLDTRTTTRPINLDDKTIPAGTRLADLFPDGLVVRQEIIDGKTEMAAYAKETR